MVHRTAGESLSARYNSLGLCFHVCNDQIVTHTGTMEMAERSLLGPTTAVRTGLPWMCCPEAPVELLRLILRKLEGARYMPSAMRGEAPAAPEIHRRPDRVRWHHVQ